MLWLRLLIKLDCMTTELFLEEVNKRRTFAIISHPDAAQPFNA